MGRPRKVPVVTPEVTVTPQVTLEVATIEAIPVVEDEFAGLSPQTVAEIKAGREALARHAAALAKD